MTKQFLFFALALLAPLVARAGFEQGVDAYHRGNFALAAQEWTPLASAGDADAARNLAMLYFEGRGVRQDYARAKALYQLAAAKCNASAQNNLGLMNLNGHGGPKDPVAAFRLFESAANQGLPEDSDAMGNLASLYASGVGTQANVIEAYKWYALYRQYTTNSENRTKLNAIIPEVEKHLSNTQKAEAIKRAAAFRPRRCQASTR